MSASDEAYDGPCPDGARARSLERIYHYLDGELESHEITKIQAHLDDCTDCSSEFEIEALLKELVRRSCTAGQAPEGLRERIQQRIVVERRTTVIRRIG
ncbi:MAG: mycothiol system anti-sigma-R factor [Brevibacterium yomogidense]|uniref:Anti-sigma factor n=1 Tax=Brevibacterium yomogidense TaxID=946573 RepID=A0A1X6XMI0_9MICO|nr:MULTISPECIES: mycothiol system anti-sigma-R factor [Brevibacterium]SLN00209.1 Anti-sigma factor [Brevibacterium yomogidense]SMX75094.1 mycothiol system anti-sigma-R factor [Brevibacterium sp. Mu109]